ncbi:MAG: GNAT family N-acetyltransferase [Flavobacteriales bacterium]|nr:GNAT family N-acetyltransferase [Flavobacteriales bacterium]
MNFNLTPLTKNRIDELVLLAAPHLGEGYLNHDYFDQVIVSQQYDGWCLINENHELIAFLVFYRTSPDEVVNRVGDDSIKNALNDKIVCMDTMVVASSYRKKGVGRFLIKRAIDHFQGEYGFIMYAWKQKKQINMERIAHYFHFKVLGEYSDLWKEDCEQGLFKCPSKQQEEQQCHCATILYYKVM